MTDRPCESYTNAGSPCPLLAKYPISFRAKFCTYHYVHGRRRKPRVKQPRARPIPPGKYRLRTKMLLRNAIDALNRAMSDAERDKRR